MERQSYIPLSSPSKISFIMRPNCFSCGSVGQLPGRHLRFFFFRIDKLRCLHALRLQSVLNYSQGLTYFLSCCRKGLYKLTDWAVRCYSALLAGSADTNLMVLESSTGVETTEALAIELVPIANSSIQEPDINKIKRILWPCPVLVCIIELERKVGGSPKWLNWVFIQWAIKELIAP